MERGSVLQSGPLQAGGIRLPLQTWLLKTWLLKIWLLKIWRLLNAPPVLRPGVSWPTRVLRLARPLWRPRVRRRTRPLLQPLPIGDGRGVLAPAVRLSRLPRNRPPPPA